MGSYLLIFALLLLVQTAESTDNSTLLIDAPEKPSLGRVMSIPALEVAPEWTFTFYVKPLSKGNTPAMRGLFESVCTVLLRDDLQLWVSLYSYKGDNWDDTISFHAGTLPLNYWTLVQISGSNVDLNVNVQFNTSSIWTFYMARPFHPSEVQAGKLSFSRKNEDPANVWLKQLRYYTRRLSIAPSATPSPRVDSSGGDGSDSGSGSGSDSGGSGGDGDDVDLGQDDTGKNITNPEQGVSDGSSSDGNLGAAWISTISVLAVVCAAGVLFFVSRRRKHARSARIQKTKAVLDNISAIEARSPSQSRVRSVVFAEDKPDSLGMP